MRPIRVLFLCTGNSARSIMAEAALRHLGGGRFDVHSAGTRPKGVSPHALRALAAGGIDAAGLESTSIDEYEGAAFDYLITLCDEAAEECPVFPGAARRMHWSLRDPVAAPDAAIADAFSETLRLLRERRWRSSRMRLPNPRPRASIEPAATRAYTHPSTRFPAAELGI